MKTYWKWILGILIVLAAAAAVLLWTNYRFGAWETGMPAMYSWHRNFDAPRGFDDWDRPQRFDGRRDGFPPMSRMSCFGPFLFLGGLFKLAVFAGLLYGAYWLGRRNARITLDPPPAEQAPEPKPRTKAPKNG